MFSLCLHAKPHLPSKFATTFPSSFFRIYYILSQISFISLTIFLQERNSRESEARCFVIHKLKHDSFTFFQKLPHIFTKIFIHIPNKFPSRKKFKRIAKWDVYFFCNVSHLPSKFVTTLPSSSFISYHLSSHIFIHIPHNFLSRKKERR